MSKNLVFSGIKHSGKSLFASLVGNKLSIPVYDLDVLILSQISSPTIREFYTQYGKEEFQKEEINAYTALNASALQPYVLSLGGGAADNTPLMEMLRRDNNYIVYLTRSEDLILKKILTKGIPPFLNKNNITGSFHELYLRRDRIYRKNADLVIDLGEYSNKDEKTDYIIQTLKENGYEL